MWSSSLTLGSFTLLLGAGTEFHATELCSLKRTLNTKEKKNYVLWRKKPTIRRRTLLFEAITQLLSRRTLLPGSGTHLNAEELCSL
jgi:hypothetical protein